MQTSLRSALFFLILGGLAICTAGCGVGLLSDPSPVPSALPEIAGIVHGGQQPVSGATIQLYAANTTTSKGASTALITSTVVTTKADGSFSITSDYTCPSSSALVYIVATGGNPGLGGSVNNSGLAMLSVLGTCGSLTSSTFIWINELTTVVGVEALAPFMADYAHVGAAASNSIGLTGAFASVAAEVNLATGQLLGAGSGIVPPNQLWNTLADILASCINSAGGTAGDGSMCGYLFLYAVNGTTADTIAAILHIVQLPAQNVPQLYTLIPASPPFGPYLTTAPASWASGTAITLPNPGNYAYGPEYLMAIDTAQHIWVYSPNQSLSGSTTGEITVYDNNGNLLFTIAAGSGGMSGPTQLAPDPSGNMWVLNSGNSYTFASLSKFSSTGAALSPSAGFAFPSNIFVINEAASGNVVGQAARMAVDGSGNVWVLQGSSACYLEFSSNGAFLPYSGTTTGGYCPNPASLGESPYALVLDGSGNIFLQDGTVTSGGGFVDAIFEASPSGTLLSPSTGYTGGGIGSTTNAVYMTYDRSQNQLWMLNNLFVLDVIKSNGTAVSPSSGGLAVPYATTEAYAIATDGGGNLWFTSAPTSGLGQVISLNEYDPTGKILTPNSGYPSGIVIGPSPTTGLGPMAVDAYGNIWVIGDGANALYKFPGLAVPKGYQ